MVAQFSADYFYNDSLTGNLFYQLSNGSTVQRIPKEKNSKIPKILGCEEIQWVQLPPHQVSRICQTENKA